MIQEDLKVQFDKAIITSKRYNKLHIAELLTKAREASDSSGENTLIKNLTPHPSRKYSYELTTIFWAIFNYFQVKKFEPIIELAMLIKFIEVSYNWNIRKNEDHHFHISMIIYIYDLEKKKYIIQKN